MDSKFHRTRLHFLLNSRTHHNSLIGGENNKKYAYMTLTHSRLSGHKKNLKLNRNPNQKDKRKAYLVKTVYVDDKNTFDEVEKQLRLSDSDKSKVESWFNNNKLFKQ